MPQFSYRARRRSGELVEGVLDVTDRAAALAQVERLGLFPVAVDVSKGGPVTNGKRAGPKVDLLAFLPPAEYSRSISIYCRFGLKSGIFLEFRLSSRNPSWFAMIKSGMI